MSSLKELIRHAHDAAENQPWSQLLVSGQLTEQELANHLGNILLIYSAIEKRGVIKMPGLLRADLIEQDLLKIGLPSKIANTTQDYVRWLEILNDDEIWAAIYTLYLGDLYGGQIIRKAHKLDLAHLTFEDSKSLIAYVRENSNNVSAEQVNEIFKWITKIYHELYQFSR